MSKLIYVDAEGKEVAEGSPESAWQFHAGDVRLDKFRASLKPRKAAQSQPAVQENDASTERVSKPGK